jgi:hypothetical protein
MEKNETQKQKNAARIIDDLIYIAPLRSSFTLPEPAGLFTYSRAISNAPQSGPSFIHKAAPEVEKASTGRMD